MPEQSSGSNKFIMWFSAVIIPVVGIGLYVYELFLKPDKPLLQPVAGTIQKPALPPSNDPATIEKERHLARVQAEAEKLCRNREFSEAVAIYENNQGEYVGFPEVQRLCQEHWAAVYYNWAQTMQSEFEGQGLGPEAMNTAGIRTKLNKCLELAPQGPYADKARQLLHRLGE